MKNDNSVTRSTLGSKAAAVGTGIAATAFSAMASAQTAFDTTDIVADIGVYLAAGTLLIGTFIAAGWALHSLGLLKKK